MDSCFPPFAALSLRDNSNRKSGAGRNGSRPISAQVPPGGAEVPPEKTGKIEILQDLDLYYIRQIAHNLKGSTIWSTAAAMFRQSSSCLAALWHIVAEKLVSRDNRRNDFRWERINRSRTSSADYDALYGGLCFPFSLRSVGGCCKGVRTPLQPEVVVLPRYLTSWMPVAIFCATEITRELLTAWGYILLVTHSFKEQAAGLASYERT
uniref:Uncharacterized protein n=1 Tax=Timema tahoe TaxID=61484 RepID=A0A7R9NWX3_9NEOP|nr:unnamed protein product [Timema tahoe]